MPVLKRFWATRPILVRIFRMLLPMPVIGFATLVHATDICIKYPYQPSTAEDEKDFVAIYQEIIPALEHFPSLAEALDNAAPELCLSSVTGGALAYLDVDENRIVLNEGLSKDMQKGAFLHELRHLEQYVRGSCPSDDLAIKEFAHATFALEADASAISLLVAWFLKENGRGSTWSALASWRSQSDIAASFANEMNDTGDVALAVSAAFDQWYASSARLEQYYLATCSDYLDRQDADHKLPLYQLIPDAFLENLCTLPDGSKYECAQPEIKSR